MCGIVSNFSAVDPNGTAQANSYNTLMGENVMQTDQLYAALAAAQSVIENAKFDRTNTHFKQKYASLASTIDATRILGKHGLCITDTKRLVEGLGYCLVTTLGHKSGQHIEDFTPLPAGLKPQELGAWLTYARRYARQGLAGIAGDDDDDGEAATQAVAKITPEQLEILTIELQHRISGSKEWALKNLSKVVGRDIATIEEIPESQFARVLTGLKNRPPIEAVKEPK